MSLNLSLPSRTRGSEEKELIQSRTPRILVIGVGGAGGNAVNNMIRKGLNGVIFAAANTDSQALSMSLSPHKIQLGERLTKGLGAGSKPKIGEEAVEECVEKVRTFLKGADMLFIAAGMGGGTGTGAAHVIAGIAQELNILTVSIVTRPFEFEGFRRTQQAEEGIQNLAEKTSALIVIPNQNIALIDKTITVTEGFHRVDDILCQAVDSITTMILSPHLINLDFSDVQTVLQRKKGTRATLGSGEAEGPYRASEAAEKAIYNPLLEKQSVKGASGLLVHIAGGYDLSFEDMNETLSHLKEIVDPQALIIFGMSQHEEMEGKIRTTVIATGIPPAFPVERELTANTHPNAFEKFDDGTPPKRGNFDFPPNPTPVSPLSAQTPQSPLEPVAEQSTNTIEEHISPLPKDKSAHSAKQKLEKIKEKKKMLLPKQLFEQNRQQDLFADLSPEDPEDGEANMGIPSFLGRKTN